jgi:CheY-like chemotaxis protein
MTVAPVRKTVLVAADTPFVRDRFKAALDGAGHRAIIVKSVAELLGRVRADREEVDLIVLDLQMPYASGANLVRSVRKLDEGRIPILVFSGTVSNADEVRELAALGVGEYLNEYSAAEHILPSIAPHLFQQTFIMRKSPRVVMGIPVSCRAGGKILAALSLDLSAGGMAIRTSAPLEAETLRLRFHLPGSRKEMSVLATVCWREPKGGMGLRFAEISRRIKR